MFGLRDRDIPGKISHLEMVFGSRIDKVRDDPLGNMHPRLRDSRPSFLGTKSSHLGQAFIHLTVDAGGRAPPPSMPREKAPPLSMLRGQA